jgi:hypothetical protein
MPTLSGKNYAKDFMSLATWKAKTLRFSFALQKDIWTGFPTWRPIWCG